jgi:hypothetical protein
MLGSAVVVVASAACGNPVLPWTTCTSPTAAAPGVCARWTWGGGLDLQVFGGTACAYELTAVTSEQPQGIRVAVEPVDAPGCDPGSATYLSFDAPPGVDPARPVTVELLGARADLPARPAELDPASGG